MGRAAVRDDELQLAAGAAWQRRDALYAHRGLEDAELAEPPGQRRLEVFLETAVRRLARHDPDRKAGALLDDLELRNSVPGRRAAASEE
jgi:hypothetical protein